MKAKLEKLEKSRVKFSIEVSKEEAQKSFDRVYDKLAEQIEIKGFRKGAAPKKMILEAIGAERLREEFLKDILPGTYFTAVQQEKVIPVEGPKVDVTSNDWSAKLSEGVISSNLSYTAEVDLLPEIKVSDYKKIKVKPEKSKEVSEDDVNKVVEHLRRTVATFNDITRPAKDGDRVEIDFEGKIGGAVRPELSSKNHPLILGQHTLIPEFEKALVGMKKGETKTFKSPVKKQQAGKDIGKEDAEFTVKMLDIKEVILPPVDDALATKFGQPTLLALRGAIREDLRKRNEGQSKADLERKVADELLKLADFQVPESLMHQEVHRMLDTLVKQAAAHNIPWEAYLSQIRKTEAVLHEELKPQAERTVKVGLILGEVVKKEGIDPKDEKAGRIAMDRLIEIATKK
jgi:trigger factor